MAPQILVDVNHSECYSRPVYPFLHLSLTRTRSYGHHDGAHTSVEYAVYLDLTMPAGRDLRPRRRNPESNICLVPVNILPAERSTQVESDEEAVKLMNDSPYGLTASIWTNAAEHPESEEAFLKLEDQLECGTVFLNR